jgi:uncharacterized coiled-coil protein SlyX
MPPDVDQLARTVKEQGLSLRAISDTVIETRTVVEQHTGQLSAIQRTLVRHERRFDKIDDRLDGMDSRLDGMGSRLDGMGSRFDEINGMLAEVLRRLPEPPA